MLHLRLVYHISHKDSRRGLSDGPSQTESDFAAERSEAQGRGARTAWQDRQDCAGFRGVPFIPSSCHPVLMRGVWGRGARAEKRPSNQEPEMSDQRPVASRHACGAADVHRRSFWFLGTGGRFLVIGALQGRGPCCHSRDQAWASSFAASMRAMRSLAQATASSTVGRTGRSPFWAS